MLLDVIAMKLEDALPDNTEVERRGLFGRGRHRANAVRVSLGEQRFTLTRERHGVAASITHVVRGIALSTKLVELDQWLTSLSGALADVASSQSRAREALDRILLGPR